MAFNWSAIKASTRRAVHDTFKVRALYHDPRMSEPMPVSVRWHNKIGVIGQETNQGYAEVIEGIDRVIFNREELEKSAIITPDRNPIMPMKGGTIQLVDPLFNNSVLRLDSREPIVGPVDEVWNVVRVS